MLGIRGNFTLTSCLTLNVNRGVTISEGSYIYHKLVLSVTKEPLGRETNHNLMRAELMDMEL